MGDGWGPGVATRTEPRPVLPPVPSAATRTRTRGRPVRVVEHPEIRFLPRPGADRAEAAAARRGLPARTIRPARPDRHDPGAFGSGLAG